MRAITETEVKREADVEALDEAKLIAAKEVVHHRSSAEVRLRALEMVMQQMNYCTDKLLRIDASPPSIPSAPATSTPTAATNITSSSASSSAPPVVSARTAPPLPLLQQQSGPTWNASSWNNWFVDEYSRLRTWRDTLLTDIVGNQSFNNSNAPMSPSSSSSPPTMP
jgi:hypothetical protein